MAFLQLAWKARKLEESRATYEEEKFRSIEIAEGAAGERRHRRKRFKCKRKIKRCWSRFVSSIEHTRLYRGARLVRTDGSLENYVLKSALGFLGGIFLTYMFFVFFVFQANFTLTSATMLCSALGVILTLGLAFSYRVRCVVLLLLPQFFSKRGRQALMAYAFILTLTGPGKNALHNIGVLSESLVCGQERLKQAVKSVIDLIKQPFYALRDAISKTIETVKVVARRIKRTLLAIKRLVLGVLRVITSVFRWLGSIVNICNKKLGTPFDRCERVFEGAVADCKAKFGPLFGGICNLAYVVGALCYIVKPLDFICTLVSYVADTIVDAVRKKVERFTRHVKAMFYVRVTFSHAFHLDTNQSKTVEDISTDIANEVRSRTDKFLAVFDWMSFLTFFFILLMLLRVVRYRYKWLTSERFDNRYLTDDLRAIDLIRTRQDKETILPLNPRERNHYIPLTSVALIKAEKLRLAKSAVFLGLATMKICIHMMADYSLYWILATIGHHGRIETKVQRSNSVGVHVSGDGYLADLYKSIVRAFAPRVKDTEIDATPCLPNPLPPDFDRYTQIATLIAFCWIMTVFEPYGLRLRHVVMCQYYPDRAKQRAAWLYNHITRSRGSFLKFARRQLRRKFGMDPDPERIERITFRERCLAICPFLNNLFPQRQSACLLCGSVERSDLEPHIKCPTSGCVGLFCTRCFADLQNLCTICRSPIEYGDLSDMSEERDSSDEPVIRKRIPPVPTTKEEPVAEEEPAAVRPPPVAIGEDSILDKLAAEDIQTKDYRRPCDCGSDSDYSYAYQKESPREFRVGGADRMSFRDVEAQRVREDVTTQIFHDPPARAITSSSEDDLVVPCFKVKARRRLRSKRKSSSCPRDLQRYDPKSTSIADTESWPTEEVDAEEAVHLEVNDGSRELLPKGNAAFRGKRQSGVRKIVAALAKIPWLGRKTTGEAERPRTRESSVSGKVVGMLPGNRRTRLREKEPLDDSSSGEENDDELSALLKPHDRQVDRSRTSDRDDSRDNIYGRDYDSHRERRRASRRRSDPRDRRTGNGSLECEEGFVTKRLPRRGGGDRNVNLPLEPLPRDTAYFEVDEVKDSRSMRSEANASSSSFVAPPRKFGDEATCRGKTNAREIKVSPGVSRDAVVCSSRPTKTPSRRRLRQTARDKYGGVGRKSNPEMPALRKYLPMYQTPELIEELKEHDRMRLIREREARRWAALGALRGTEDWKSRGRTSRDNRTSATRLTEEDTTVHPFPYQETQTFKDVLREFRDKMARQPLGEPLISLSRSADKCKDLKQLFPPESEDRGGQPMYKGREETRDASCKKGTRFQEESLGEATSPCSSDLCKSYRCVAFALRETSTDNDDIIP